MELNHGDRGPQVKLQGVTESGSFRTAAAKEYPDALCRTLVIGLVRSLRIRAQTEGMRTPSHVSPDDDRWIRQVLSTAEHVTNGPWLPDYQGPWNSPVPDRANSHCGRMKKWDVFFGASSHIFQIYFWPAKFLVKFLGVKSS